MDFEAGITDAGAAVRKPCTTDSVDKEGRVDDRVFVVQGLPLRGRGGDGGLVAF